MTQIDMNRIVGQCNILFVCMDSLRYDVAKREEERGTTPTLNRYGVWRKCQAPGNFTYPSHQAMFAGFLPVDNGIKDMKKREKLFFSEDIGMGRKAPEHAFCFEGSTFVEGLAKEGYDTYCVGGLSFFDKRTDIGKVMPAYFKHSFWNPSFGCKVRESAGHQIDFAVKKLRELSDDALIMMYMNISALHYPNHFYVEGAKHDSVETHAAALRYVDGELERLFAAFQEKRDTFVICCSDHGTCYGEDGYRYHGLNHPVVNTVPYKHFLLKKPAEPYQQYMYSYPHKTAYGPLVGIRLEDYIGRLSGKENSLYFHIPFCQSKCGYCNLFSVAGQEEAVVSEYVDAMERHADQLAAILPEDVKFADLTLGGGTPLYLSTAQLERIFVIAEKQMGFSWKGTSTIVETSPGQTTEEKLQLLKEHHVTRLSMGVQSFCEEELRVLNRSHTVDQVESAMESIRRIGFSCVNLDLIYGIPGQTIESLLFSVDRALAYEPDELFVYPLYIKKDTYLSGKAVRRPDTAYEMYCVLRRYLRERGYEPYSMRRFVRGGDVTTLTGCGFGNTISIGCGGRSYIDNLHFCTPYGVRPSQCRRILRKYIEEKDHRMIRHGYLLSGDEMKRRYVIRNILFGCGLSEREYETYFSGDLSRDFPILMEWILSGYACEREGRICLTETGYSLSDQLGPMLMSDEVRQKMRDSVISPLEEGERE